MKTVGVTDCTNQTPPCILDGKMSKFNILQNEKYLSNVHKIEGAHLQCVNNRYSKFQFKGMKTLGVTDYKNQTQSKHFGQKIVQVQHPAKMRKYSRNVHKIKGAHLQCMNNNYTKFE